MFETPRGLDLLYRTAVTAEAGNQKANNLLLAFLGAAGAGLLGLGIGGVLIAAGLGWLLGEQGEGENKRTKGGA